MKNSKIIFLLVLMLSACTELLEEPIPEIIEAEVKEYFEFEGIADMDNDASLGYGDSSENTIEEYIHLSWEMGKEIVIESNDYEFEKGGSEIYGVESCRSYSTIPETETPKKIVFKPGDGFWECLELENCDPGDEVFEFRVMIREVD